MPAWPIQSSVIRIPRTNRCEGRTLRGQRQEASPGLLAKVPFLRVNFSGPQFTVCSMVEEKASGGSLQESLNPPKQPCSNPLLSPRKHRRGRREGRGTPGDFPPMPSACCLSLILPSPPPPFPPVPATGWHPGDLGCIILKVFSQPFPLAPQFRISWEEKYKDKKNRSPPLQGVYGL